MKCTKCGEEVQQGWRACPSCGTRVEAAVPPSPPPAPVQAPAPAAPAAAPAAPAADVTTGGVSVDGGATDDVESRTRVRADAGTEGVAVATGGAEVKDSITGTVKQDTDVDIRGGGGGRPGGGAPADDGDVQISMQGVNISDSAVDDVIINNTVTVDKRNVTLSSTLTLDGSPHPASLLPLAFFGSAEISGIRDAVVARRLPDDYETPQACLELVQRAGLPAERTDFAFYGFETDGRSIYLVRRKTRNDTLFQRLERMRGKGKRFTAELIDSVLRDIIGLLERLPQKRHGHLTPGNVGTTMKRGERLKATTLLDAGMARVRDAVAEGSPSFRRELQERNGQSPYAGTDPAKADVTSLGLIGFEMLGVSDEALVGVRNGQPPDLEEIHDLPGGGLPPAPFVEVLMQAVSGRIEALSGMDAAIRNSMRRR